MSRQCKQCGATLPESSRYCLQCGTSADDLPATSQTASEPQGELDFLKPALAGGLALGILSALPFISAGNILCCMWVQGGGALTAWLLHKQRPGGLKYGDGALGGLIAGLIGAFVATLISIPIRMLTLTPEVVAQIETQLEQLPPAIRNAVSQFLTPGFNLTRELVGLVMNMALFGLFAIIGGILMVAILQRKRVD